MIALPRQITCQNIMAAAREQAWSSPQQVLGLPTRLGDEPQYTRHWDLTAIAEVLDQATALQWGPDELTAWDRDNQAYHFAITRPGRTSDPVGPVSDYVVADAELDQLLRLAQDGSDVVGLISAQTGRGKSEWSRALLAGAWTITCPAPDPACARPQDADLARAGAEALASDHDGLHHGGSMTAEVARTSEMTR
jgi:hypothetical protein